MIGISGYARTGKDTLSDSFCNIFINLGINAKKFAFANCLKEDINEFCLKNFNISSFTKDDDEKKIIRPILVGYGEASRNKSRDFWIKRMSTFIDEKIFPIISDVRYENEADWILEKNGYIISLDRKVEDEWIEAANNEEKLNSPIVRKKACFHLHWLTLTNQKDIDKISENLIEVLFSKKIQEWKATYPL